MKLHHSLLAAALLAGVSTSAAAQSTGVVTLSGTIVPTSCTVTLDNGGTAAYGVIDYQSLSQTGLTNLAVKNVTATFDCTGPTLAAFTLNDNQLASNARPQFAQTFGLGESANAQKIGYFVVATSSPIVDTVAGSMIQSGDLSTWQAVGSQWNRKNGPAGSFPYRAFGSGSVLSSFTEASFVMAVTATIESRNTLQLTQAAQLEGNATLEIRYL